jgi:uncharacterized membrane protein YbhN (UPF0104 family)
MRGNAFLSYFVGLLSLSILFFFIDLKDLNILFKVSFFNFLIIFFLTVLIYFFSGVQYYFIRKQFGVSLSVKDILLLPIVGNLWSFIIPFQGNLMFTTVFFRKKYNMEISESFSISIYLYLITLSFTGFFILLFSVYQDMLFSWLSVISLLLILNPFFLYLLQIILGKISLEHFVRLNKLYVFLTEVIVSTNKLWSNLRFTMLMFFLDIIKIGLNILWFYWIAISLDFDLSILTVAIISLIMTISIIIKFTPDNLGVAQLVTASFIGLIGGNVEATTLITLFASAISIVVMILIGIPSNIYYFKVLNLNWSSIKNASKVK